MINFSKIKGVILIFALILTGNTLKAQAEMHLSLDSAKNYALRHNKNLINAGLAIDEAGQRLREAIAQGLPQVDASLDYSNFFGSTATLGAMPGFEITFSPTSNLSLSVGQLIFSGSYIVGVRTARLLTEISEVGLERSEQEIKAQVAQAYYIALISMKSRYFIEANLENMRDVLMKTRAMVDTGIADELDYDQLNVQANMLKNALSGAERQVVLAMNMLRLQMGVDSGTVIILTDNLEDIVDGSDFQGSLASPFSLNENLDFQIMQLQKAVSGKQVDLQRSAYLPTIMGFYNYTEKLMKPEFDIQPKHVIGLNVSIPIFSSGLRQARVNQARINLQVTENQMDLLGEQLMIQEVQLRFNLNNAFEQYQSQQANVEVAQRVFENIRLKFQQGLLSSLDLTTASNNYLQAESSYIASMLQLLDAQVELDKLLNGI
jgi:outer membrane protein